MYVYVASSSVSCVLVDHERSEVTCKAIEETASASASKVTTSYDLYGENLFFQIVPSISHPPY